MADSQLEDLLRNAQLTDEQRAGLWDVYQAARNPKDLASRLETMQLPDALKADLWDLKAGTKSTDTAQVQQPSAGTWIDRGMAGMAWKPASGVKEGDRADVQVLGVPPELAAIGLAGIGNAAAQATAGVAPRVIAGARATASMAVPLIKFKLVKAGLEAVGIPGPAAEIAAYVFSGAKRGSASTAATEAEAAEATAMGGPQKMTLEDMQKRMASSEGPTPLEMTRKVRDEYRAMLSKQATMAADKPKLTADEVKLGMQMVQSGMKGEDAIAALLARRKFADIPTKMSASPSVPPQAVLDLLNMPSFRKLTGQ